MKTEDFEELKEEVKAFTSYIKPSVITMLRKNKKLWTERDRMLRQVDPTYYPAKSVMIKRAVCDSLGVEWD